MSSRQRAALISSTALLNAMAYVSPAKTYFLLTSPPSSVSPGMMEPSVDNGFRIVTSRPLFPPLGPLLIVDACTHVPERKEGYAGERAWAERRVGRDEGGMGRAWRTRYRPVTFCI
ncbi:hypothetical protein EI94DRAFT_1735768 [Lactarius quietus]|nr:hypothetical protein EI94DRAFT_1735768 [Lactarius quietus]